MAGVLNFRLLPPISKPILYHHKVKRSSSSKVYVIRSSTEVYALTPPPNFKPPEPKQFVVRPDKTTDLITASLDLLFRFGTGVFVSG